MNMRDLSRYSYLTEVNNYLTSDERRKPQKKKETSNKRCTVMIRRQKNIGNIDSFLSKFEISGDRSLAKGINIIQSNFDIDFIIKKNLILIEYPEQHEQVVVNFINHLVDLEDGIVISIYDSVRRNRIIGKMDNLAKCIFV